MSSITTINATDLITDSRAVINTNFSNLNTDKIETSYLDTDTTLAANSDVKIPSQKAVKAYVDAGGSADRNAALAGLSGTTPSATNKFVDARALMGTVSYYTGDTAPTGWLLANGAAVSRTTYANLFSLIGTSFGTGDGSTTFNVPNVTSINPSGLVSYWKLDESSGNAVDSKGVNTLTNVNTATFGAGKINNGANMASASSQYFKITDAAQTGLDITGNMTFACWLKASNTHQFASKYLTSGNQASWSVRCTPTTSFTFFSSSDGSTVKTATISTAAFTTNVWHHVALVYTAATPKIEIFVNGVSVGSDTSGLNVASSLFNSSADFILGCGQIVGGEYLNGSMDEVGIWNVALTDQQIVDFYNFGTGIQVPCGSIVSIIKY